MASFSRTPSPAAGSGSESDSVVATPMTPRTKMRQLFATIDGDDDSSSSDREREEDAENQTPSRKAGKTTTGRLSTRKSPKLASTAAVSRTSTSTNINTHSPLRPTSSTRSRTSSPRVGPLSATSDEESDVELRPRGRLAARMQANSTSSIAAATEPAEPLADNARERVKRMLQQAAKAGKPQPEPAASANPEDTNDAEDEDDVSLPAARPRKRLTNIRTSRRSTSASSNEGSPSRQLMRDDSPAMFMTPSKRTERENSPDMFMTPSKGGDMAHDGGADTGNADGAGKPARNARFQALVARKREEARAREEAEERKRAARQAAMAEEDGEDEPMGQLDDDDDDLLMADAGSDNVSDISDDEGGRKLSQKAGATRPARQASKKALEEMHRETQRMSRNLQLAHEAKTRKKITKASLFERFNFKPQGAAAAAPTEAAPKEPSGSSRPASPVSLQNVSDTEVRADGDTPPSSPPVPDAEDEPLSEPKETAVTTTSIDKGKGKAVEVVAELPQPQPKRQVRVRMPISVPTNLVMIDSDDDAELEIVQTSKCKINLLFDSVPLKREQEPRSMLALRRLAQVSSPGKKTRRTAAKDGNGKPELSLGELQQDLQSRARLQAKVEREQRLEALRAKGIRVQTEEEREKELEEVDDIVTRARQEAEELMQREREEAKQSKKGQSGDGADGEADPLDWDDSEDDEGGGDYTPEDDEENMKEIELSGSDDDENDDDDDEETVEGALIDDEAESAEESEDGDAEADATGDLDVLPTPIRARSTKRRALIVSDDEDEDDTPATTTATPIPSKMEAKTPGPKSAVSVNTPIDSPQVPTSVLRSATKPFIPGMPVAVGGPAGLGLTQIFAGTLGDGDSQLMGSPASQGFGSSSQLMPTIGNFAEADFSQRTADDEAPAVMDSQLTQQWLNKMGGAGDDSGAGASGSHMVDFNFSQSQAHGLDSILRDTDFSQMSQLGPSQDLASQASQDRAPLNARFFENHPSTIETVLLDRQTQELKQPTPALSETQPGTASPTPAAAARPKGRLVRKADLVKVAEEQEEEEDEEDEAEKVAKDVTAFARMKKAAAYEKQFRKKSKAKEMVEDQAEESEDEYAGLGGADGEDSDDESLASVKDLIDDQKVSSADNAKLAAFYADRERENDEKQVEKLFRDVTTGMLRRKRGAGGGGGGDYDLSDSDDGGEARRRMKRRQFARMQKALFSDERVSKVAENPRNHAFMRTIEDRGSDDEMDFLFEAPAAATASSSAPTAEAGAAEVATIPDSQPLATAAAAEAVEKTTLTHPRRRRLSVTTGKKPSNLGEIRESLSSLLEDYQHNGREASDLSLVADSEFGSDDEEEHQSSNKENNPLATATAFRRPGRTHNVQVVDRISLKRNNSSASSASSSTASSSAAAAGGSASSSTFGAVGPTGFRVPALLRRATTNSIASNSSGGSSGSRSGSGRSAYFSMSTTRGPADKASSSGSGSGGSSAADNGKIKKNASKMSGIHYFARENERLAALAENDKRRQAKKVRSAEGRSRAVGGLFGAGKFE